jgi:hypothetical protein
MWSGRRMIIAIRQRLFLWRFKMQIHFEMGELLVIGVLAILALFWLIPVIGKRIINRLKKKDGK